MKKITLITALAALIACNHKNNFDASGNFIADEVIVSAQQNGQLISYNVQEGQTLTEGQKVGQINTEVLQLQKQQVEATIATLKNKTLNPDDQAALIRSQYEVQKAQLEQQQHELSRVKQLVAGGAATQKQLDDLTAAVSQLQKQLAVTQNQLKASLTNINTQNNSILSQEVPLQKNAEAVQAQINQGEIINPTTGTVLVNYQQSRIYPQNHTDQRRTRQPRLRHQSQSKEWWLHKDRNVRRSTVSLIDIFSTY